MKKTALLHLKNPCFDPENYEIAGLGETWITCLAFTMILEDLSLETCVLPLVNGSTDFWIRDSDYAQAIGFMRAMLATDAPKSLS